ncbi:MAG: cytochrome-c oxidase, cbb3-type subunit III [Alphaproteobacteria bacterium]|nr:cytochrome-c oxidase, cbb3-type subunit III [Alphaproteobacteria bacterium]
MNRTDDVTGFQTTGHEWDGIEELNRPLPRWWLMVWYACILWALVYFVLYPAWPLVGGYTKGVLGYSQRQTVAADLAKAQEAQSQWRQQIASADLTTIEKTPELFQFAVAGGKAAFGDNCAPCHGTGAQGFTGYPNLNDDDWLWGGSLDAIHTTIRYGIRSTSDNTRLNDMMAFGRDQILNRDQINDVTEYVLDISHQDHDAAAAERGKQIFTDNCVACHGEGGVGNQELGAPNLTDAIWLYGGDRNTIRQTVTNGRKGVMPTWEHRLDPVTIKQLAVYVHSLGGGQ